MSAALEVQKAVVAAVRGSSAFTALAGQRFFAEPSDAAQMPYASIVTVASVPAMETQDSEGDEVAITIHVWALLDTAVQQIMAAQKAAIHNQDVSLDTLSIVIGRETEAFVRRSDGPAVQGIQRFRFLIHP